MLCKPVPPFKEIQDLKLAQALADEFFFQFFEFEK